RDITKRKKAEEELAEHRHHLEELVEERTAELRNANEQLQSEIVERAMIEAKLRDHFEKEKELRQQLEAEISKRVEFTRTLTHELKTPLTSVLASGDVLVSELREEPLLSLAKNVSRGASDLNSRIDELLDLAKGEVGMLELKLEPVDMLQSLREIVERMSPVTSKEGQSLIADLPPSLPLVQADTARLQQVVTNLISNASKFTPEGGKITLRVREKDAALVVEVQDTGRGITREEQKRLFEPYYRIEGDTERFSGLGLGLPLCKTLVELHRGQIWVRSQPGKGSTFGFSLPLEDVDKRESGSGKANKLWKVLIIEDNQDIVDSISLAFQIRWPEARLISTKSGEQGIEMVETEAPDIVILDLGLPDTNGFEVLRQVRLFSSVPIVILTVKAEEDNIVKGLGWGADDYIVKPFKQTELLARLKVQLRRQTLPGDESPIVSGALRLDPSTSQLTYGGRDISLTVIEGRIMQCLMTNAGRVATYTRLAEAVWGDDYPGALDSLRVYIRRLREKLEEDPGKPALILTKPGVGYSLAKPVWG
ncbi:MAG: ATP-binding protein, partial [Dehalococcoidia bacterium]